MKHSIKEASLYPRPRFPVPVEAEVVLDVAAALVVVLEVEYAALTTAEELDGGGAT